MPARQLNNYRGNIMQISLTKAIPLVLATLLWSTGAFAGSATFTLTRVALTNVPDAAGTTQHEAGTIKKGTTVVGDYYIERRADTLTGVLFNAYPTRVSLLFPTKTSTLPAPENIIAQGVHEFNKGSFKGSVSASSSVYSWVRDADVSYTQTTTVGVATLVITWLGSATLVLP
jgi:hypothetical protein